MYLQLYCGTGLTLSCTSAPQKDLLIGGSVDRNTQPLPPSSEALRGNVLPVKPALSPEQRLSETTCSSVSGDYLLCPQRCQIIKHSRPLSSRSQSPRGSLLLRPDVLPYEAALLMSRCDSPLRAPLTARTAGRYFNSEAQLQKRSRPPFIYTILMIIGLEVMQ